MSIGGSDASARDEIRSLRDLSPYQWKSGIAAWLGWLFDGLDMHLYVLVAAPFVAELVGVTDTRNEVVGWYSSWIQAAFLVGWALGGGFFGRVGDRIGRSRALCLTILTYALFTGLAFFAQTWWQLLIVRFLAALGIGGEWAVGASLLSETWPRRWRPWIAAVLQSGVNIGILLASCATFLLAGQSPRVVFLVGVLPALLVFWIRREVPETEEWRSGQAARRPMRRPGIADLFRGEVRRTTILTILVCSVSLTAHWAFMFWYQQHLRNLPDVIDLSPARKNELASIANFLVMAASILGNFLAAVLARVMGYRRSIALLCLAYFAGHGRDLQRAAQPHAPCWSCFRSWAHAAASSRSSRCICRRCSRSCCERPGPASATTSAASPRRPGPSSSGCSRKWATTGSPSSAPGSLFLPATLAGLWLPELPDHDLDTSPRWRRGHFDRRLSARHPPVAQTRRMAGVRSGDGG